MYEEKVRSIIAFWRAEGCRALALGEKDLTYGMDTLRELLGPSLPILVCANLRVHGNRPFAESLLLDLGEARVLFTSLLDPSVASSGSSMAAFEVEPPHLVMQRIWSRAGANVDMIVVCVPPGLDGHTLAPPFEDGPPIVLLRRGGHADPSAVRVGPRIVDVTGRERGRDAMILHCWKRRSGAGIYDLRILNSYYRMLRLISKRNALADGAADRSSIESEAVAETIRSRCSVEKTRAEKAGLLVNSATTPLSSEIPDSRPGSMVLEAFRSRMNAPELIARVQPVQGLAGSDSCRGCHPLNSSRQQNFAHASSVSTLVGVHADQDAECLSCHSEEAGRPLGCESCDGPARDHVGGSPVAFPPARANCGRCHTIEHSPHFVLEEYLERSPCGTNGR